MDYSERSYSLLLVSDNIGFATAIKSLLQFSFYDPISSVSSLVEARQKLALSSFDIVLVDYSGSDDAIEFSKSFSQSMNSVILLFLPSSLYSEISASLTQYGVFSLVKPISRSSFLSAMEFMKTCSNRVLSITKRSNSLEDRLEEMKILGRAKLLLMENMSLSEESANSYITRMAMDRGIKKKEICAMIIKKYSS